MQHRRVPSSCQQLTGRIDAVDGGVVSAASLPVDLAEMVGCDSEGGFSSVGQQLQRHHVQSGRQRAAMLWHAADVHAVFVADVDVIGR